MTDSYMTDKQREVLRRARRAGQIARFKMHVKRPLCQVIGHKPMRKFTFTYCERCGDELP